MNSDAAAPRSVEVTALGTRRPPWSRRAVSFCARVLEEAGAAGWEVAVLFCDDESMRALNSRYRGKNRPTDVLSFPREDGLRAPGSRAPRRPTRGRPAGAFVAGDIAIALPTMRRNAREFGCTDGEELKRLLVHGILHLAGMDHGRGKGRAMLALQEKILAALEAERIIRE